MAPHFPSDVWLPAAYRVPWRVDRSDRTHPRIVNAGDEPVDFVRAVSDIPGKGVSTELWGQVLPAEHVELCLCDGGVEDVVVTLAWFRQHDGLEYVWRFVA